MKRTCCISLVFLMLASPLWSQPSWKKVVGGSGVDYGTSVTTLQDGGHIATGFTESVDGDIMGLNKGSCAIVVSRIDRDGNNIWLKTYGGSDRDFCSSVLSNGKDGFVITGATESRNGDFGTKNKGGYDAYLAAFDLYGRVQWNATLGGSEYDSGIDAIITRDSSYVVVGQTFSNSGNFKGMGKGDMDVFVANINRNGSLVWCKVFGGSSTDAASAITNTSDGGCVVTGWTISVDGDFSGITKGNRDLFAVCLDAKGNIRWKRTYGGSGDDEGAGIARSIDGGFVITGSTNSLDGDLDGKQIGGVDIVALKIDDHGSTQWIRTFGGSSSDEGHSISATPEGGFIIAGATNSRDGLCEDLGHGDVDACIFKIDSNGAVVWKNLIGGTLNDEAHSIVVTPDGGCVVTGSTSSNDGDFMALNKGRDDLFIIKLDKSGRVR